MQALEKHMALLHHLTRRKRAGRGAEEVLCFPTVSEDEISIQPNLFHRLLDTVSASGWEIR